MNVVKKYAQTEEGLACLNQRVPEDVYINPYDDERSQFYLHHEKLPFEVQELLADKIGRDGWARVSDNFADFYMTLLANRIASQRSLELLTPSSSLSNLAAGFSAETYHQPYSLAHSGNEALGRAMLTNLIIDGITIDPLTSIDDLRIFKEKYQSELQNFRVGFDEISKMELPPDITIEGLEQRARDMYEIKFLGAYRDLQESLKGLGIHFLVGGMGTIAFSDVSTSFNQLLNGLDHPVQLTIGVGALLAYKGYKTVKENREIKRKHKMSYMLAIHSSCLYVGDTDLKNRDNKKKLKELLKNTRTDVVLLLMQIPHHGSKYNVGARFEMDFSAIYYFVNDITTNRIQGNVKLYNSLMSQNILLISSDKCKDLIVTETEIK